jgi:acyl carrier protein
MARIGHRRSPHPPHPPRGHALNVESELKDILAETLSLDERAQKLTMTTPLLGSIPELDSMAVVSVIAAIEERFGMVIADDEIDAATFETFGSLVTFVQDKLKV